MKFTISTSVLLLLTSSTINAFIVYRPHHSNTPVPSTASATDFVLPEIPKFILPRKGRGGGFSRGCMSSSGRVSSISSGISRMGPSMGSSGNHASSSKGSKGSSSTSSNAVTAAVGSGSSAGGSGGTAATKKSGAGTNRSFVGGMHMVLIAGVAGVVLGF